MYLQEAAAQFGADEGGGRFGSRAPHFNIGPAGAPIKGAVQMLGEACVRADDTCDYIQYFNHGAKNQTFHHYNGSKMSPIWTNEKIMSGYSY